MQVQQTFFLEAISPKEARYKAVATIDSERNFRQEFFLARDVPTALSRVCASGEDTYLSICDFQKPRRTGEAVFGFSAFGFDIDCHNSENPAADALHAYEILQKEVFSSDSFPTPSMVEHTGRGLLVLLTFQRAPRHVLPLWLRMGEGFAQVIRDALPACATLDDTYADASRVVRVPGTRNMRADRDSYLLDFDENFPVYELHELRDRYFPNLHPDNYKNRPKKDPAPLLFTDSALQLHVDRLQDLTRLCELRNYRVTGMRENILFLYRYWTCYYVGPHGALQAALELNATFSHPLTRQEVLRATKSAEKAFEQWRLNKARGYNYRNDTLIELLAITPGEQRLLKTIISKEEKAFRRAAKAQWGNEKRDDARASHKKERDTLIRQYALEGLTRDAICSALGCSSKTVSVVLRKEATPHEA